MPTESRINIPFIPQEGITAQILSALQLANEQHRSMQQLGIQQQQANTQQEQADTAAQKAPAEIEEAKARAGFYGTEAQKNQLDIDMRRQAQQMFAQPPQAAPQGTIAPIPNAPGQTPTPQAIPNSPGATPPLTPIPNATGTAQWLPSGTPPQLAPFVSAMIPKDLSDLEKNVIESGAQTGRLKAMQTGSPAEFLNEIRAGVDSVVGNRNKEKLAPEKQPIEASDRKNFLENVLPSMENLSEAQKTLARGALQGAKSQRDLQSLQARLMQQDQQGLERKINQQNIVANKNLALTQEEGKQGLADIIKVWTDPQHGFGQTLAQANVGKMAIKAGADGNGLLTSLEPTMAVLGMNSFAGVHRISPAEATAASAPGGWSERFNAWADKATKGELSPQLAKEGQELFNILVQAKHQQSLQATQLIVANTPGLDAKNIRVASPEGEVVKLTDALKAKPKAPVNESASGLSVGQIVPIGGKQMKITAVHPDGTFDATPQ